MVEEPTKFEMKDGSEDRRPTRGFDAITEAKKSMTVKTIDLDAPKGFTRGMAEL